MEACHAKDAHDEECHTALLAATAKLRAHVMPCDPQCNYSLRAVPSGNVRHSHSIVYAKHATSFALLSTVVHVAKGRRQARQFASHKSLCCTAPMQKDMRFTCASIVQHANRRIWSRTHREHDAHVFEEHASHVLLAAARGCVRNVCCGTRVHAYCRRTGVCHGAWKKELPLTNTSKPLLCILSMCAAPDLPGVCHMCALQCRKV